MRRSIIMMALILAGCSMRAHRAKIPHWQQSRSGAFSYQEISPNHFVVIVKSDEERDAAIKELNCVPCFMESVGEIFTLEKLNK